MLSRKFTSVLSHVDQNYSKMKNNDGGVQKVMSRDVPKVQTWLFYDVRDNERTVSLVPLPTPPAPVT